MPGWARRVTWELLDGVLVWETKLSLVLSLVWTNEAPDGASSLVKGQEGRAVTAVYCGFTAVAFDHHEFDVSSLIK